MAKQSAWNTKTVQRYKEKAMAAAEKRIKSFRKLQLKSLKQAEKEERHINTHRRKLFSARSTSDINLVGTSIKNSTRDLYQFSDQFGDNLYLKSAKSLHDQVDSKSKGSKRYNNTSLSSRDCNSNMMKFSDIVNEKKTIPDHTTTNSSICSESTITSKIRSIGGVSRKVHLKKLMQSISSPDNQKSISSTEEMKIMQSQSSEGNHHLRSLNDFGNVEHMSSTPRYDTQSLNVNSKRQSITSMFQQLSPKRDDQDAYTEENPIQNDENHNNQEVELQIPSPISNDYDDKQEYTIPVARLQSVAKNEKSMSRAISVPHLASDIDEDKVQQVHNCGEYIINPIVNEDRWDNSKLHNKTKVQKSIQSRYPGDYIQSKSAQNPNKLGGQLEVTRSRLRHHKNDDLVDKKTPSMLISAEKQNRNFNTLDDSIGSAGSLAQRNTVSTTSSSSNTKSTSSSSSMSFDNTFESVSVQTNGSSSIFDNHQHDTMFIDKNDLLLRKKLEYQEKDLETSSPILNVKYQRNDNESEQDAIDMFLMTNGLTDLSEVFHKEKIDLEALMLLTEDDLKSLQILLGPRRKLLKAIHDRSIQLHDTHIMIDTPL